MAQPLQEGIEAFCPASFGTNNLFASSHVQNRWSWMQYQAKSEGIILKGFSSDGDTRLLKSMESQSFPQSPSVPPEWTGWFIQSLDDDLPIYVQDTHHIGTKLRNVFLKPSIFLPIGSHVISSTHLIIMIDEKSKEDHEMTTSDINRADKMNFRAVEKIGSERVISVLKTIPSTEGTIVFLKILKDILDSFLVKEISLAERVNLIWGSVVLLRIWKTG